MGQRLKKWISKLCPASAWFQLYHEIDLLEQVTHSAAEGSEKGEPSCSQLPTPLHATSYSVTKLVDEATFTINLNVPASPAALWAVISNKRKARGFFSGRDVLLEILSTCITL